MLVVEDSARLQNSMSSGLQAYGYTVDVVTEGTEAITCASRHAYDVIILDLMLPKESSLLVLHEIREQNREVEILIVSARDQIHDRVTALIQGADDYLVKPFSCADLHTRIQSLVRRRITPESAIDNPGDAIDPTTHLNRLIQNLLQRCRCDPGDIELVISEIKLSVLLKKLSSRLSREAAKKDIVLQTPACRLPTLLVDAKWMEHLLTNLLNHAISHSPDNAEIRILFQSGTEFCALEIENQMSKSVTSDELKSMFKDFHQNDVTDQLDESIACLSLAKSYADCMNLELNLFIEDPDRFRIRVSNIKIV